MGDALGCTWRWRWCMEMEIEEMVPIICKKSEESKRCCEYACVCECVCVLAFVIVLGAEFACNH